MSYREEDLRQRLCQLELENHQLRIRFTFWSAFFGAARRLFSGLAFAFAVFAFPAVIYMLAHCTVGHGISTELSPLSKAYGRLYPHWKLIDVYGDNLCSGSFLGVDKLGQ